MTAETPLVITAREGFAGVIRLNRPKSLNALTLPMVRLMRLALDAFLSDPSVVLVVLEAVEGRAFCAGGDIRACAESGRAGDGVAEAFWREEYELIARLAASDKPIVALMDGIVMGGGAGLAMHLKHRVATEKARFAMPEVGIGFLPDVGASFLLPRLPNAIGHYLALTGQPIGAGDMVAAGLADHLVRSEVLPSLRAALTTAADSASVEDLITAHATTVEPELIATQGALIARAFAAVDVTAIRTILGAVPGDDPDAAFAAETLTILDAASPYSLALTTALLRLGAASPRLEDCLVREFRAAGFCLSVPDFHEGVRAAVIDKDRKPVWPSATPGIPLPPITAILASRPGQPDPDFTTYFAHRSS